MIAKTFVLLALLSFISCTHKQEKIPDDVLGKDEMKSILTDIHIAQAATGQAITADSSVYSMKQYLAYILKDHSTGKEKFLHSIRFYSAHPDIMEEVYDSVLTDLSRMQGENGGR